MLRESLVIDGTAKTCKGVIAGLERGLNGLAPGDVVLAIVEDIPTRVDVYAWAERKGHRVLEERRRGPQFLFYIVKGASRTDPLPEPAHRDPVRDERESTETPLRPEVRT